MNDRIIGSSTAVPAGEEKPKPQLKDAKVKILNTNTVPMRTRVAGDVALLILGLGDDGIMYSYNAQTKEWYDRV